VPYENVPSNQRVCATTGADPGADFAVNFQYYYSHLWRYVLRIHSFLMMMLMPFCRNFGILIALIFFFLGTYIVATEFISAKRSKGEVLLFPRSAVPKLSTKEDEEATSDPRVTSDLVKTETKAGEAPPSIQKQTAIFHWEAVNYDIKIKKEPRRLLDDVDGWVKPGTLTALMVSSP